MAVGLPAKTTYADGDVFSASDINDTNGTLNLVGQTNNFYAGKNKIINGDFNVWQRGTSFTVTGTESIAYKADRWSIQSDGSTTTRTVSRQAFTPGTAPVAGYEGNFFFRFAQTTAGNNSYNFLSTRIENVSAFAGQTVTLSFWAKADSARTVQCYLSQNFGPGGSSSVNTTSQNNSLTTSWTRFTYTTTVGALTGKTIGASNFLEPTFQLPSGSITPTIDIWGVMLEAGSTATAFETATGTIQGELAACQRYYERRTAGGANYGLGMSCYWNNSTQANSQVTFASPKRTAPSVAFSGITANSAGTGNAVTSMSGTFPSGTSSLGFIGGDVNIGVASGGTTGYGGALRDSGAGTGYIEFSSEL
jgi:hypothetical protein